MGETCGQVNLSGAIAGGVRLTLAVSGSRARFSHGRPSVVNRTFVWAQEVGSAAARCSATQELHHGLSAGVNVQLLIGIGDVAAQRAGADTEVVLDLFVEKPLGELLQNLRFPWGKPLEFGCRLRHLLKE